MLMRFDPFRELDSLSQALAAAPGVARASVMAMDAYRDGDRVIVHLDIPGIDPDSIDLTVEKNVLSVTAERNWEPSEGQEVLVSERRHGRFTRQLFLGDSLDPDRVEASVRPRCPDADHPGGGTGQAAQGGGSFVERQPADRGQ